MVLFPFQNRFLVIVFQVLDDDTSGCLDREEIREAFDAVLHIAPTDAEFETAVTEMDRDGDGLVSFQEFRKFFKNSKKRKKEIFAVRAAAADGPAAGDAV